MSVRKTQFAAVASSVLLALSVSGTALAGGTSAGGASGATISGSSSIPSASMSFFSGSLTTGGGVGSGTGSIGGFGSGTSGPSNPVPTPPSLSGILGGFSPGTQVTLQGPSGSFVVTVGGSGSIDSVVP